MTSAPRFRVNSAQDPPRLLLPKPTMSLFVSVVVMAARCGPQEQTIMSLMATPTGISKHVVSFAMSVASLIPADPSGVPVLASSNAVGAAIR